MPVTSKGHNINQTDTAMITKTQLLDAIATAILNKQDLYIDRDARSAATPADFEYRDAYDRPAGYDLLLSTDDFIASCVIGEEGCADDDYISARDIERGWDREAEMPTWEQIRDYVSACDSNDNFEAIIESLDQMDVLPCNEDCYISYTLTRDEYSKADDETPTMTCSLRRPDGSIAGTYRLAAEDGERWAVIEQSGADWDVTTDMTTGRDGSIEYESDDYELDRCYNRGMIVIRIGMPFSLANLNEEEMRSVYACHEQQDEDATRVITVEAARLSRLAPEPYTLRKAVDVLNVLIYVATALGDALRYDFIDAYDDEDAAGVRHYPARHQVATEGSDAEEYLRAVWMMTGLTPDDAESDEDNIFNYFNA